MALSTFESFLKSLKTHALFSSDVSSKDYVAIDLSVNNPNLREVNVSSSSDLEYYIWNHIQSNQAKVAFGGYLEMRGIYQRSAYFNQKNNDSERNIHIGLDLWIEAHTSIFSPLGGHIHSFKNNMNHGDYGPTLILKHQINDSTFYTLYGHLSLESIANKKLGAEVKQGEQIATLGISDINGDYPPHLHFQIIRDIQDYEGDYPGVSNHKDLSFYKNNCPNPHFLIDLD